MTITTHHLRTQEIPRNKHETGGIVKNLAVSERPPDGGVRAKLKKFEKVKESRVSSFGKYAQGKGTQIVN